MIPVLQSLKALKASFSDAAYDKNTLSSMRRWSLPEDQSKGLDSNFTDGLQSKEVSEINTSHAKILDLLKSNTLQVKCSNKIKQNYVLYICLVILFQVC